MNRRGFILSTLGVAAMIATGCKPVQAEEIKYMDVVKTFIGQMDEVGSIVATSDMHVMNWLITTEWTPKLIFNQPIWNSWDGYKTDYGQDGIHLEFIQAKTGEVIGTSKLMAILDYKTGEVERYQMRLPHMTYEQTKEWKARYSKDVLDIDHDMRWLQHIPKAS